MKTIPIIKQSLLAMLIVIGVVGCATESHQALTTPQVASAGSVYQGPKSTLMVGKFDNRSSYMRGLFFDGVDRLGGAGQKHLDHAFAADRSFPGGGSRQHG